MSTASPAVIDQLLDRYTTQVGTGFGLVQGDVQSVFGVLMVISLGLSALLWALDEQQNVPAALIRKILLFGFFAWLITGWRILTLTVINGFAFLGLKAGGGRLSIGDLMQPSSVVRDGIDVAFSLFQYIGRIASEAMGAGFFMNIDAILVTALAALGVLLAFVVLGIEIAVTIIEFYIVTLIGFVTVPFGILTQTAFMSERAIGYVVSVGAKIMALALVVSIGEQIFSSFTVSTEPAWPESVGLLAAAVMILMLALKIPALAAAQITGGPQLSAGSAAAGAVGLAATVGGLALAGRWATGARAAGGAASSKASKAAAQLPAARGAEGAAPASSGGGGDGDGGGGGDPGGGGPTAAPPGRAATTAAVVRQARQSFRPAAPNDGTARSDPADGEAAPRPWVVDPPVNPDR
jgi:type IV secretion system protein TrbL